MFLTPMLLFRQTFSRSNRLLMYGYHVTQNRASFVEMTVSGTTLSQMIINGGLGYDNFRFMGLSYINEELFVLDLSSQQTQLDLNGNRSEQILGIKNGLIQWQFGYYSLAGSASSKPILAVSAN